jgi:hypothetical protein
MKEISRCGSYPEAKRPFSTHPTASSAAIPCKHHGIENPLKSFLLALFLASGIKSQSAEPLELVATIPLPGVSGRFDHFAIDPAGQRLFVAALGNNTAEIFDVAAAKRIKSIPGLRKPTGIAFLKDLNQFAIANGEDGSLKIFHATTYQLIKSIPSLDDADNVRLDMPAKRIYVGYGDGALGIIDTRTMKQIASIKLAGHPESFQLETNGSRVFVNLPAAKQIAVVDRTKESVIGTWPMTEFRANFPMALDEPNHRLFVGCRQPARIVIFDTSAGRPIDNLEISGDTDDLFYDHKRSLLYISCGEGFIDVIQCAAGNKSQRLARIPTRAGARTSYFSAELDRFFLAIPNRIGHSAELRIYKPN